MIGTDGKIVRTRFSSLKLHELSSVDRPAQAGALATVMKNNAPGTEASAFMTAAAKIKKRDQCSLSDAMTRTRKESPQLFAAFQVAEVSAERMPQQACAKVESDVEAARQSFLRSARTICKRDNVPLHVALSKARREEPMLFSLAYE